MAFNPPKFEQIRDSILRDIKSMQPEADISIDSDYYIRASSIAACCEGQYAHQSWIARQIFADTADTEFLEWHAATRDIYRKAATTATGLVRIFGDAGSVIKVGLGVKWGDLEYRTTENKTIAAGKTFVEVKIIATQTGLLFNTEKEKDAMLTAAPAGCRTECVLINALGGTAQESDASLLDRYLERVRRPPAGGNKYDLRNWALEVPGVTNAYVYPLRRGLGTVDIAITSAANLPSKDLVKATQEHIDDIRPVTAKETLVVAPIAKAINFDIKVKLQGITLAEAKIEIQSVLDDYFLRLAPAATFILSQVEALISDIVGITDRKIVTPKGNQEVDLDKEIAWFRMGTLKVSEL